MKVSRKKRFFMIFSLFWAVFLIFVIFYEGFSYKLQKRFFEVQGNYLAEYLWNLDQDAAANILEKVLELENLYSAEITHNDGSDFVKHENTRYKTFLWDDFFGAIYLLREDSASVPILWKGEEIGLLRVRWINHNVYIYLGVGFVLLLLAIIYETHLAFRERDEQYRELVENANSAIVRWDKKGNITFVNEFAESFFGYKKNEIVGKPFVDTIVPEIESTGRNLKQMVGEISRCPERFESIVLESKKRNGDRVWLNWTHKRYLGGKNDDTNIFSIGSDITEQKKIEIELKQTQRNLIDVARMAGKAEVAISVLHNVGNLLNSVNTSISTLKEQNFNFKLDNFFKALNLLEQHKGDLNEFIMNNPQGKLLPEYFSRMGEHLKKQRSLSDLALEEMDKHISHITDIISVQQTFARNSGVFEKADICELLDEAIKVDSHMVLRHNISLIRQYDNVPELIVDRYKVMQILLNLIKNAIDSLLMSENDIKQIVFRLKQIDGQVCIEVEDNGVGIHGDDIGKLFSYGFTTKKDGHGFGLHGSANFAKEMNGSLSCQSQGKGAGAVFSLALPFDDAAQEVDCA